jgi:hypothetical protein
MTADIALRGFFARILGWSADRAVERCRSRRVSSVRHRRVRRQKFAFTYFPLDSTLPSFGA